MLPDNNTFFGKTPKVFLNEIIFNRKNVFFKEFSSQLKIYCIFMSHFIHITICCNLFNTFISKTFKATEKFKSRIYLMKLRTYDKYV